MLHGNLNSYSTSGRAAACPPGGPPVDGGRAPGADAPLPRGRRRGDGAAGGGAAGRAGTQ